jgi:lipoprotein-anchoring transpeptidase ErfK/SrfK
MAQPDLNLQLEHLRERLIALKREAVVYSEPAILNRRPNTVLCLLVSVLFFLYPSSSKIDDLGPFVRNISQEIAAIKTQTDFFEQINDFGEFKDQSIPKFHISKMKSVSMSVTPEMRYASSQIIFVNSPNKINFAPHMEYPPVIDKALFQISGINSPKIIQPKSIVDGVIKQIDDFKETIIAVVDKSDQKLHLYENGLKKYSWEVSTARKGKVTPTGTWNAQWLSKYHKSSIYNNAPMPYAIFYDGNFAIHGTDQIGRLGTPASSGCVRLHPENAAVLYAMVEQAGKSNFAVRVID